MSERCSSSKLLLAFPPPSNDFFHTESQRLEWSAAIPANLPTGCNWFQQIWNPIMPFRPPKFLSRWRHAVDDCEILHHQKDGWNPRNNGINHLSTGAGFLPSTVSSTSIFGMVATALYPKCLAMTGHGCLYSFDGCTLEHRQRTKRSTWASGKPTSNIQLFHFWKYHDVQYPWYTCMYIYSSKHAVDFPMRETWLCIFCK